MDTELAVVEKAESNALAEAGLVNQLDERSRILVESGYFPDLKSIAQAKVKVWIGKSLGLSEFQSLTGIYITPKGQIGLSAITMGTMVREGNRYDYQIEKLDDTQCEISFHRIVDGKRELIGTSKFDLKDAAKCGLVNKDTFKSYPRNMLLCRALANGARWYAPEMICGCYAVEELDEADLKPAKSIVSMNAVTGEVSNGKE